jgi:hypothetical protein
MNNSISVSTAFNIEMQAVRVHITAREYAAAFSRLERAHILGQQNTWRHTQVHLWMLRLGWQRRDVREVLGQLLRIPAALLFSKIWVPLGNTGGANVSALQPMPVPEDLAAILSRRQTGP